MRRIGRYKGSKPQTMTIQKPKISAVGFGGAFFRLNDDVVYAPEGAVHSHSAKIIGLDADGNIEIQFKDQNLIPCTMKVPMESLKLEYPKGRVNVEFYCPKCEVLWQKYEGFRTFYFNCPQCGAKKEDYSAS